MSASANANKKTVHIRWMVRRDMPDVLEIERGSFDNPWIEEDFLRCLRQRNVIGMVAESGETVVGFMVYELHPGQLDVLNFAVHPNWRRLQVGRQMAEKLISKLSSHRRTRITLNIRERNMPGQFFFHAMGFRAKCVVRNFYDDTSEDAYVMEYRIKVAEPFESAVASCE